MAGLLDYFNNQSNPNAGAWGGNPMGGDSSGSTAGAGFMGGMQDPRAAYRMQQMLKASMQPVKGTGGGAWASALSNLIQGYMGGQNESGYQDYAQNQEAKSLQMDYLRAQGQERAAQAKALEQKAATDQKRQGIVSEAIQRYNSPNQGLTNGPTTPEYSDIAPKMATPRSNDPRDLYSHVATALENGGDLAGGYQQRIDAMKLSPQVEKYDVQIVNGQPRQVAMMKDGTYKVLDGVAPTANLQFENLGDRTAMIDKYTGAAAGSLARGQSPDSVASNQVQMRGQNMTDLRARELNSITQSGNLIKGAPTGYRWNGSNLEPIPGGPAAEGKPLTDSQSKAYLFGTRMQAADAGLARLPEGQRPSFIKQSVQDIPLFGNVLGPMANLTANSNQQSAEQYQDDFSNAALRRESGAAIANSERVQAARQYFPQPNDGPDLIKQKAENRRLAVEGIMMEVPESKRPRPGAATNSPKTPMRGQIVDGHQFKGGDPADPNNWAKR